MYGKEKRQKILIIIIKITQPLSRSKGSLREKMTMIRILRGRRTERIRIAMMIMMMIMPFVN